MTEQMHTPGPWSFQRELTGEFSIYGKDEHGFTCQVGTVLDEDMGNALPALANAYLTIAGPDMLQALLMVQEVAIEQRGLDFNLTSEQWAKFRAAISKATVQS